MITVRPHLIFSHVHGDRDVTMPIPDRPGLGGLSLLETYVLIAAARIVNAKRIFEIGTFLGRTTLNLARNVPEAEVFTLDLEDASKVGEQMAADTEVMGLHFSAPKLDFEGTPSEPRITRLLGNSTTFDYAPWHDSMGMVFIDGGHDVPTARSDTENALRLLKSKGDAVLAWHDYANRDYPELSDYLDGLSQDRQILHVGDTMLCLWFGRGHLTASLLGGGRSHERG